MAESSKENIDETIHSGISLKSSALVLSLRGRHTYQRLTHTGAYWEGHVRPNQRRADYRRHKNWTVGDLKRSAVGLTVSAQLPGHLE